MTALVIVAWTRGEPQKVPPVGLGGTIQSRTTQGPAQPVVPVNSVRLIVRAKRGPCWLSVHRGSATGSILYQGTLEQGQNQIFRGRRLWITLDRPENLQMILNGRTRLLPVGGVKTLIVTPRSIRPAV